MSFDADCGVASDGSLPSRPAISTQIAALDGVLAAIDDWLATVEADDDPAGPHRSLVRARDRVHEASAAFARAERALARAARAEARRADDTRARADGDASTSRLAAAREALAAAAGLVDHDADALSASEADAPSDPSAPVSPATSRDPATSGDLAAPVAPDEHAPVDEVVAALPPDDDGEALVEPTVFDAAADDDALAPVPIDAEPAPDHPPLGEDDRIDELLRTIDAASRWDRPTTRWWRRRGTTAPDVDPDGPEVEVDGAEVDVDGPQPEPSAPDGVEPVEQRARRRARPNAIAVVALVLTACGSTILLIGLLATRPGVVAAGGLVAALATVLLLATDPSPDGSTPVT